jgi:hypothetical protein
MNGHGREIILLGVPIADAPPDVDNMTASAKGKFYNAHIFYLCFFLQPYYLTFPASIITIDEVFCLLNLTEKNVESIPSLFQDIIERMVASQVMTVKPDACIIDFYNEVASYILFCSCWVISVSFSVC